MKGWKKLLAIGVFISAVTSVATASVMTTLMSIPNIGPFFSSSVRFDSLLGGQVGGMGHWAVVGGTTDTLLIGDVVYWSDTNKVTKSATLANYKAIAGVVVGGARTSYKASIASADVGTVTATTGQRVFILQVGRTWMKNGQNDVVPIGRRLIPSDSIAGRFDTTLTAALIDTFSRSFGRTVTKAAAVGVALVDVNVR